MYTSLWKYRYQNVNHGAKERKKKGKKRGNMSSEWWKLPPLSLTLLPEHKWPSSLEKRREIQKQKADEKHTSEEEFLQKTESNK